MKNILSIHLITVLLFLCGCGTLETIETIPEDIIRQPLGTESIKIGMTKDQVKELWGAPDDINYVEDKKSWGGAREEWVYKRLTPAVPLDAGYLSKTKRLYFDGENLTNIRED